MTLPTPQARAKQLAKDIGIYVQWMSPDTIEAVTSRCLEALSAEAQAASVLAHDIIYAIRCELEQPQPSMEKIREYLKQWEMRR